MSTRHQRFYDGFMLVLGLFLGVLVGIAFMKAFSAASAADRFDDPALVGDVQAGAPRLAQGFEVLSERVISRYQGDVGIMPPKGGRI